MTRGRLARIAVLVIGGLTAFVIVREAGTILIVDTPIAAPEAIVSLSSHEWERLPATAQLALKVPAATVILTRPSRPTPHTCHRCDQKVFDLAAQGVPLGRIVSITIDGSGTFAEADTIRRFVESRRLRSLQVVTSAYHTRRATATFRKVFRTSPVAVGVSPADPDTWTHPRAWWWHDYDRRYVVYEWAATLFYAVRHGVRP